MSLVKVDFYYMCLCVDYALLVLALNIHLRLVVEWMFGWIHEKCT